MCWTATPCSNNIGNAWLPFGGMDVCLMSDKLRCTERFFPKILQAVRIFFITDNQQLSAPFSNSYPHFFKNKTHQPRWANQEKL